MWRRKPLRHPVRNFKDRIMTAMSFAGFLAGLLKYVPNIDDFIVAAEALLNAPLEEKWDRLKPIGDLLWPVILDMTKLKASEYDIVAMEAELEAKGFDGHRLRKIWDGLSPLLVPLIIEFLKGKVG